MADDSLGTGFGVSVTSSCALAQSAVANITTATIVKATSGRLMKVSVIVAGSATGTVNDVATTGAAAAVNQIGTVPQSVGTTTFDWPCADGLVVVPGSGQTLAVSYT